jgi:hypothetical protein
MIHGGPFLAVCIYAGRQKGRASYVMGTLLGRSKVGAAGLTSNAVKDCQI